MAALLSLLVLAQWGIAASLEAGDCAFVGMYGDKDDFAMVLLEDANEKIYLTEEKLSGPVRTWIVGKDHVTNAKRGTVLRKEDFEHGESLVATEKLHAFIGSPESPQLMCSIRIGKQGEMSMRRLEEADVVLEQENGQYAGVTTGTKEELVEEIMKPSNWLRDTSRKLQGFSIDGSHGGNHTHTMTTTPMPMNMTTTMMADADTTMTTTMTTSMTAPAARTVVSGCTELGGAVDALVDSADALTAFAKAIAAIANVPESYVENVVISLGGGCGMRRLGERRLQGGGTATYDIVFPASLGALGSNAAAQQAISSLSAATPESVTTTLTQELQAYPALASISVEVTSFPTPTVEESGGSTPPPPPPSGDASTTSKTSDATTMGITLGLLMVAGRMM